MVRKKMNKYFKELRKYKWVWLAGIVIVVLLVVLLVMLMSEDEANQEVQNTGTSQNTGTGQVEESEVGDNENVDTQEDGSGKVVFRNLEFLNDFLGSKGGKMAEEAIDESILGFIGDNGDYTAFVAGKDVEKGVSFPFDTLDFVVQVSNGENFYVQVALEKDTYFGMLVGPMEGSTADFFVGYLRSAEEGGYNESEVVEELRKWASVVRPGTTIEGTTILRDSHPRS